MTPPLPFRAPCTQCRGYGLYCGEKCKPCSGLGVLTVNEQQDRIEIRDRHEEQIAGARVIVWGFAALLLWLAGCAVGFFLWWGST
jgi:hypothetical protein